MTSVREFYGECEMCGEPQDGLGLCYDCADYFQGSEE